MTVQLNAIRPSWAGYSNLKHLVIFGDSYSDVGYQYSDKSSIPTHDEPLGIPFPGVTWAGPGMPNWVGYLITEHTHHPLLVYNYAVGGASMPDVRDQIQVNFMPRVGQKPDWAPWTSEDTLFTTWVGINDCGFLDPEQVPATVEGLFAQQHSLYKIGARNFLFIDVPPIHRSPVGVNFSSVDPNFRVTYEKWNASLQEHIAKFAIDHPDATTLFYSSWDTLIRVMDDLPAHGFKAEDASRSGGDVWTDHIHPTHKVHDWFAHDIAKVLHSHPPYDSAGHRKDNKAGD
ncbi:SGNH hydrolase-type esterase domain-containing protein [Epithele typhae]|uniref:SGNH hydrolase-type esterase domain-containing protein n=1 Tax=Epithele typhae TaxID=378194 RepID=UPI00200875DB|nr:SGNH hydrolase-type esterase domain-containing protein [Epithele typhae]KAH9946107.1 SGNH hydrolase-type esterase domain-containing protein [Epithele typhae]